MKQYSAAERRYFENVTVICGQRILFSKLAESGTPISKLGEIAETTSGGTPDRNVSTYFGGVVPWLKSGELNDGLVTDIEETITESGLANSNAKILPVGTLLIALYGATVGKTGILGVEAATNQAVCAVTPKKAGIRIQYLLWFLRSKREDFLRTSFGGAQPNISQRILRDTLVPIPPPQTQDAIAAFLSAVERRTHDRTFSLPELPPPLTEQWRAVARTEELVAQIQEARGLRGRAAEEARALTVSLRRALFGESPQPNWIPLDRFIARIENGRSPQCDPRAAGTDEWGVLKVGAISFGSFDERENKALPLGLEFDPRYEVRTGDFLMSRANTTELVGACAIVGGTRRRLLLSDKTFRFHFRPSVGVVPTWLDHALKSPALRNQIERGASGTSPTMKNISKEKVLALLLPPHSLTKQNQIVAVLDGLQAQVESLKNVQSETAGELDALLPAILDRAFKGELV